MNKRKVTVGELNKVEINGLNKITPTNGYKFISLKETTREIQEADDEEWVLQDVSDGSFWRIECTRYWDDGRGNPSKELEAIRVYPRQRMITEFTEAEPDTGSNMNVNHESIMKINDAIDDITDALCFQCDELRNMLLEKNEQYGNAAMDPLRVYVDEKVEAIDSMFARMDEKLSQALRGNQGGEDVLKDMIGILILIRCLVADGATARLDARKWLYTQMAACKIAIQSIEQSDEEQIPPTERDPGCREF